MASTRRLAAILAADVAGYWRLMGADEEGTLGRLRALRAELIDPMIAAHNGGSSKRRVTDCSSSFRALWTHSVCATELQASMAEHTATAPADKRIEFRIGINAGDIVVEDGDIFGDGVNVAARLEGLAEPGGICVSARVQEDAAGRLDLAFEDMGEQQLRNIARPVRVYALQAQGLAGALPANAPSGASHPVPVAAPRLSIVVLPFANMSGDPEQQYFADGITEDLTTELSRIAVMLVI